MINDLVYPEKLDYGRFLILACILHCLILFTSELTAYETPRYSMGFGPKGVEVSLVQFQAGEPESAAIEAAPPETIPELPAPLPEKLKLEKKKPAPLKKTAAVKNTPIAVSATAKPQQGSAVGNGGSPGASKAVDLQAAYLNNPPPRYPSISKKNGEEGVVLLQVKINGKGQVLDLSVKESSGYSRLDSEARNTVKRWLFKPATFAGFPVTSEVEVPIRFKLNKLG